MKRILIFSLAYYPRFVGGAEIAIKEITDRLSVGAIGGATGGDVASISDGIEFDLITLRLDKRAPAFERIGNVNVHRVGWAKASPTDAELTRFPLYLAKVFFPLTAARKARELDRTRHYDALWAMMSYMGFPALFFNAFRRKSLRAKRHKIPFILTLQEGDTIEHVAHRWRIRLVSPLYRLVFRRAAIVQAISHYLADFARHMGYDGKIEVVPNGVDVAAFSRKPTDTELFELKSRLGKKYTDTFLITTSRLVPKNGVGDIIRALAFLPAEIKLLVAGTGPQEAELKALALAQAQFGATASGAGASQSSADIAAISGATVSSIAAASDDRVRFLGFIPHADLPLYLRASDIFVRPSLSEGFGNSFIEAMAAELPVIATPVGGIVDFLEDKRTGLFCEPNDPHSIARAVEHIMASAEFRDSLILNAKKMVTERYDWSLVARDMKERVFSPVFDKI